MKRVLLAFQYVLREVSHDLMLVVCLFAPILMGVVFRFLLPLLEQLLCEVLHRTSFLAPYYALFDLLLAVMTPVMFSFAGMMVILLELDDGTARYLFVTPLGKSGYLLSRLGLPTALSVLYDVLILALFTITRPSLVTLLCISIAGGAMGLITSLLVVSFAKNKVEGMAYTKLCGILLIGLPISYFVHEPIRYLFALLPSFWLAEFMREKAWTSLLCCGVTSMLFLIILYRRFAKRLV